MSIAVSVTVVASRRLRALLASFGAAQLGAAGAVGLLLPGRFVLAPWVALAFLGSAAVLLRAALAGTKLRRIDISGLGQFRLTVQQGVAAGGAQPAPPGQPVSVAGGSTAWPQLMLLRLRGEDGALAVLPILPDSVGPDQFRALAVAVRAAGTADEPPGGRHKIL